jgi:hypothetical protein
MSHARQMLDTYRGSLNVDALRDCAEACIVVTEVDLSEQNLAEIVNCIRLCLDCTDVCAATIGVASRQAEYHANVTRPLLEACVAICNSCGDECERHARTVTSHGCLVS